MKSHFYASVYRWLLRFITFQLFISLMSLPLLIAWGLPLSLLSPFGNGLFNPLLTLFLLLSALIFIAEIMYVPNQWLCWLLEKTNKLFITTSSYADSSWLIGIRQLPLPILFVIPIIGLWIIITPRLRTQGARALALAGALVIIFAGAYVTNNSYVGTCNSGSKNKTTVIAYADHTLAVFDYGMLNASFRYRTWWEYTLMSEITKKTGKTTIDYLVILKPSEKAFEGIIMASGITTIHHVIILSLPEKLQSLQDELASLKNSLKAQRISCTVHSSTQEQPTHKLTAKISYLPHTNSRNICTRIIGATITCDKQTLTIGTPTDTKILMSNTSRVDKLIDDL
jgi:hypothetical protein